MSATITERSEGHLLFTDTHEYFAFEGQVLRAPLDCPIRCDVPLRNGARFECYLPHWTWMQENGIYPFSQSALPV